MLSSSIPQESWERVHIHTLELPRSENGFKYLFIAIDFFSRLYYIIQPVINKKAETIVSVMFREIITTFTTPNTIITDNAKEFKGIAHPKYKLRMDFTAKIKWYFVLNNNITV